MTTFKIRRLQLIAAIALLVPALTWASAAKVDFVVGAAVAVTPAGVERKLVKGSDVQTGEIVRTGDDGRIQLRFTDGAMLSLQPQSDFRLDNYQFSGKEDGQERGFFSLLKGGLRKITGLIGRSNRANYQTRTSVATIGIRGTEYTVAYLDSERVAVSTGEGAVEVCVGSDCVVLSAGESAVAEPRSGVSRVSVRPRLQPTQPLLAMQPDFSAAECRSSGGVVCTAVSSGPGQTVLWAEGISASSDSPVNAVFSETGALQQFTQTTGVPLTATQVAESSTDGVLGWGRWASAVDSLGTVYNNVAYVAGRETNDFAKVVNATYYLSGSSSAVSTNGNVGGQVLQSYNGDPSRLTVSVGGGIASLVLHMYVPINSTVYYAYGTGTNNSAGSPQFSTGIETIGQVYGGNTKGAFYGPDASHAGISYKFLTSGYDTVSGVAVFKK